MSFEFDAADNITNKGGYLSEVGTYHLIINEMKEGVGPSGKAIDGFTIECLALGGTVEDCADKKTTLTFFAPNLSGSEKAQAMSRKRLTAFFIAVGLVTADNLGKALKVNLADLADRQFIVKLSRQMEKDGDGNYTVETKFLQISYADIWHVDDPAVDKVPKSQSSLRHIDASMRRDADFFAAFKKGGGSKKTGGASVDKAGLDEL